MTFHEGHSIEKHGYIYVEETQHYKSDGSVLYHDGDSTIIAPDGVRISVTWFALDEEDNEPHVETIFDETKQKSPHMTIGFPKPIRNLEDLLFNFHTSLPFIKEAYERVLKKRHSS